MVGFSGVTSSFGLPINKLGVVTFTCSEIVSDVGESQSGARVPLTEDELSKVFDLVNFEVE